MATQAPLGGAALQRPFRRVTDCRRAPRGNPASLELDQMSGRDRRRIGQQRRAAANSAFVQGLAMELADAPEEQRANGPLGMDTAAALRERHRLAAREAIEEELMVWAICYVGLCIGVLGNELLI